MMILNPALPKRQTSFCGAAVTPDLETRGFDKDLSGVSGLLDE